MKKIMFIALGISLMLVGCESKAPKDSYEIKASIAGLEDQQIVLKKYFEDDLVPVDLAMAKDGAFVMKGKIESPEVYYITFSNSEALIPFFIENAKISMRGHVDSLRNIHITGSKSQELFTEYQDKNTEFDLNQRKIYGQYVEENQKGNADKLKILEEEYDQIDEQRKTYNVEFIKNNPSSVVSAYVVFRNVSRHNFAELSELTSVFSPELHSTFYYKKIKERLEILARTQVGAQAPDFTQNDANGNPFTLSQFRGKYVLLDFWASWCGPCRAENPVVVKAFDKYKHKNFTVFGVSLDNKKENWLKAIEDDKLTWTNVSDLQGWKNVVSQEYGISGIPQNFLIDPNGVIISVNLRGEKLMEELEKVLK